MRGRVGRGEHKSYCLLLTEAAPQEEKPDVPQLYFSDDPEEENLSWKRLKILEESGDGFYIANADLDLRGPGDFLGARQSGALGFRLVRLEQDGGILDQARLEAERLLREDPELMSPSCAPLRKFCDETQRTLGGSLTSG